jgi:hypothetical protein
MIKSRIMKYASDMARTEEKEKSCSSLVRKIGRKKFGNLGTDGRIILECIINKMEDRSLGRCGRRMK